MNQCTRLGGFWLRNIHTITCCWLGCLCFLPLITMGATGSLALTEAEHQWLKAHPVIRVAPDPGFAPFEWFDSDDSYHGMAADYLFLIEKKLNIQFEIEQFDDWVQALKAARSHKVDMLPALARTPQREKHFLFTEPHITVRGVIVTSKGYKNIQELRGKRIVVVNDYVWDDWITYNGHDVDLYRVENNLQGMELVALGVVDAMVIDFASVTYLLRENGFTNLRVVQNKGIEHDLELSFAIRNDWPELHSILAKTLSSLTAAEKKTIQTRWLQLEGYGFWRNPVFWYSLLGALAILFLLLGVITFWNRLLRKLVEQRTQELQAANLKLMQAEKMESIGRLAAGIAHEVKNPLAIIQMGADYLSQEVEIDEVNGTVLKDIEDAVQRADSVIHGLLDFSRDKKLSLVADNINQIIENSLKLVNHELRQSQIEVKTLLDKSLPELQLDANKLQQVFINIFMNAAHAIGHDGQLVVKSLTRTLSQEDLVRDRENVFKVGDQILWVEILDNGPGIIPADIDKIFDPFYTTKSVGQGTGLGLSVSRNIINLHHGSIDIRNRPEGGASVSMMFKLASGDKK